MGRMWTRICRRYIHLERELAVNAPFFAQHVKRTLDHMGPVRSGQWLSGLMTGDQGYIFESYAYGSFAGCEYHFNPLVEVPSADLYRQPGGPVALDGEFNLVEVLFDIKSLSRPSDILEDLLDRVNQRINPQGLLVRANGSLDFDHAELDQAAFGAAENAIVGVAAVGASYVHEGLGCSFRFFPADQAILMSEGTFNPYRFAQENRHVVMTHAKQVHRSRAFMFVYVYTELDHELAVFPDFAGIGERAIARRVFVELCRSNTPATQYCRRAAQGVTVQEIARSIGALLFLCVKQRTGEITLRFYLNPNANEGQVISFGRIEQLTDFAQGLEVETFMFDNY